MHSLSRYNDISFCSVFTLDQGMNDGFLCQIHRSRCNDHTTTNDITLSLCNTYNGNDATLEAEDSVTLHDITANLMWAVLYSQMLIKGVVGIK